MLNQLGSLKEIIGANKPFFSPQRGLQWSVIVIQSPRSQVTRQPKTTRDESAGARGRTNLGPVSCLLENHAKRGHVEHIPFGIPKKNNVF